MGNPAEFVMLQCENPDCRFRCPSNLSTSSLAACPLCGRPVHAVSQPFINAKTLKSVPESAQPPLHILLDNLRSTLNVGSIFRTADGAGVTQIHLCGTTPTPDHPKIAKTGLGAEGTMMWDYHPNGLDFVMESKRNGFFVIVLEASGFSRSIFTAPESNIAQDQPVLLVVGNEVSGVDPLILDAADLVLAIPMHGSKSSLNVAVAFGIAVYTIQEFYFGR